MADEAKKSPAKQNREQSLQVLQTENEMLKNVSKCFMIAHINIKKKKRRQLKEHIA